MTFKSTVGKIIRCCAYLDTTDKHKHAIKLKYSA